MRAPSEFSLNDLMPFCTTRLDQAFLSYIKDIPARELKEAMEYTLLNGGKRLRPLLIYATGCIFDAPFANMDIPASAVEIIHTYSLIHDDLPCMDNADYRRGKPTCHQIYGEGMAVLTGDALHTLAMQIIATHPAPLKPTARLEILSVLSKACGAFGMAAGQALDISLLQESSISPELLVEIYHLKTGALLAACVDLGRISAEIDDETHVRALRQFGECIGLAFQIQDDILDIECSTATLGKPQGQDDKNNKITYPLLFGVEQAKDKIENLYAAALDAIHYLGHKATLLRQLTHFMLQRQY